MAYPFDRSGTEVGADGVRRYTGLPRNLPQMLRGSVEPPLRESTDWRPVH